MAPGSYSKKFFGISTFQMMYQSNFFFKNHKTELMGVDKIKKYVLTQKISLLAWKIAVLQTFLYHFRTPENPNISKAHIFWLATVMSRTKLILTWFDILLSLEHSGAWPHGAFLISSILRAVSSKNKTCRGRTFHFPRSTRQLSAERSEAIQSWRSRKGKSSPKTSFVPTRIQFPSGVKWGDTFSHSIGVCSTKRSKIGTPFKN